MSTVWPTLRSTTAKEQKRQSTYEFLLAFHINHDLATFSEIQQDIGQKSLLLTYPYLCISPHWVTCRNIAEMFSTRKLESLGYHMALFL